MKPNKASCSHPTLNGCACINESMKNEFAHMKCTFSSGGHNALFIILFIATRKLSKMLSKYLSLDTKLVDAMKCCTSICY